LSCLHYLTKHNVEIFDILIPVMTKNISAFMSSGEPELAPLVTQNLGEILNKLNMLESKENEVNILMYTCLSPLVLVMSNMSNYFKGKRAVGNADEQTRKNLANMIALLSLMQPDHYKNYVNQFIFGDEATGRLFLKSSLMSIFGVFKNLIEFPVFPLDWNIMNMLQNNVILKGLGQFASTITNSFTNGSDFEAPVWSLFFKCATTFIDQPTLQLENFMENKKLKILNTYGDMRKIMGKELNKMWFNLGENKIHFVPDLVSDVLKIALIDQPDLRESTIPIFFDMILCENAKNANFQMFQDEFITKLDHFIGEDDLGNVDFLTTFNSIMMSNCEKNDLTAVQDSVVPFVEMTSKLIDILLDRNTKYLIEHIMSSDVRLLNFYSNQYKRDDLFVKYTKDLVELHGKCHNKTEEGFTILKYAKMLNWSEEGLEHNWKKYDHVQLIDN